MSQCLNPDCLVKNLETHLFCQKCGFNLRLRDRYQAVELIGQGGFGKTFLAIDYDKPRKPYCIIKQFFPQVQGTSGLQKAAELFAEEAKRLDDLGQHSQIPELLAYFIHEDQRQYLVQEYIEGQNLEQELKAEGVFDQQKIRQLLGDLLPVLNFIHQNQVIHRDIKPENIIRRKQDNKFVLVDFGAAKAITPLNCSVTGTMIGSAEYMAPEQVNGKPTNASDLYSLGVTCLYLLTGVSPFDLFDAGEHEWVWQKYLVDNQVDGDLEKILNKLVCFGTKKRYKVSSEVLEDLNLDLNFPSKPTQIQSSVPVVRKRIPIYGKAIGTYRENVIFRKSLFKKEEIEFEMIMLSAGEFWMGSPDDDKDANDNEKPEHLVKLNKFAIGKYPVTNKLYTALTGENELDTIRYPENPVEMMQWDDAKKFCQKLNQITGKRYRFPSEAEWEYACRAGTQTKYYFGDDPFGDSNLAEEYGWFEGNSGGGTCRCGRKTPNNWGLYAD